MTTEKNLPPIAITMGDPSGIGGEILLKAAASGEYAGTLPNLFAIDDPNRLQSLARDLELDLVIQPIDNPAMARSPSGRHLPVLPLTDPVVATPGEPTGDNAFAVIESIELATRLCSRGEVSAVVTNPIHKGVLFEAGFRYPGHTEFLAHLTGIDTSPVMMVAGPSLRVVPVTIHQGLAEALNTLSTEKIVETGRIAAEGLIKGFGLSTPRLAIAGLNPHAGEGGAMGREEIDIISPAIEQLAALGLSVSGPVPPDALFTPGSRPTYDAAICMYHDQALIPVKSLDFDQGVNVTLGLPIVRTSPDHGTAFDIAGKGIADPSSLIAAIRMAGHMATHWRKAAFGANT